MLMFPKFEAFKEFESKVSYEIVTIFKQYLLKCGDKDFIQTDLSLFSDVTFRYNFHKNFSIREHIKEIFRCIVMQLV